MTEQIPALLVILGATPVGSAATLAALKAILSRVYVVKAAMRDFEETGTCNDLTEQSDDELGRLMNWASRLMHSVRSKLEISENGADPDPLTSVLNRRGHDRRVKSTDKGAIIYFGIDFLTKINDRLGHDKGDEAFFRVCRVCCAQLSVWWRAGTVWLQRVRALSARNGTSRAQMVAKLLRTAFSAGVVVSEASVTASVGVEVGPEKFAEPIKLADEATYEAKRGGRNQVRSRTVGGTKVATVKSQA